MNDHDREAPDVGGFAPHCLSLDLEVGITDQRIHKFAGVRGDDGRCFIFNSGNLTAQLAKLDDFAEGCAFLLGHNLIAFDAPHLAAAKPDLRLLKLPMVDTLLLNPLAFPRNPYHHLVKHYQDGQLQRGQLNDPKLDACLTLEVFRGQQNALRSLQKSAPDLLLAWHWLTAAEGATAGLNAFFMAVRRQPRPSAAQARAAIEAFLRERGCVNHVRALLSEPNRQGWALAYALAWLSVAGGNSVMPPWVRHQFPDAGTLVRRLRDTACGDPDCAWCRDRHSAMKELKHWFPKIPGFRSEPAHSDGRPLQQCIVEAATAGEHVLGILPTGTGKSLCYQILALSRYDKIGALTVVISPLVALMADQIASLKDSGITCCAAINGLLSPPERAGALDRARLGDVGILLISPEQLRNRAVRTVLAQREIGAWVLDEAHCISKWGHDFRPDYRYVGRFIKESAGQDPIPTVLCLTATAKPDVIADIVDYFHAKLSIDLRVFDGGASRANLEFAVLKTTSAEKFAHVHQLLENDLPPGSTGGAIVYCATRKRAEEIAEFLRQKQMPAEHFHSKLTPDAKQSVQNHFKSGDLRVIAATNAFGMGIDKSDVRLVIHADIPGSLENYLQEAGRAGRDQAPARCVLLYASDDVERQFFMSARSRLNQREIQAILKALRNLDRKKRLGGEVVATAGEILSEESEAVFERDSATDDTRVRVALAWLEETQLLSREENRVQIFPSSLRVQSVEDARRKLENKPMFEDYRNQLLSLVEALIAADADQGLSTDELMGLSGLNTVKIRAALYDLERLGIASNDTSLTAFVHVGTERSSKKRLEEACDLETALLAELRQTAPELKKGEASPLHLRQASQHLKDRGHVNALPEKLWGIVESLSHDGRDEDGGAGSLHVRRLNAETAHVTLGREWSTLDQIARRRRAAADRLLNHLLDDLPSGTRGMDILVETTLGKLMAALERDLLLKSETKNPGKLLDRALLWLHEQQIIRLNKGLAIFRSAMTIRLAQEKRNFLKADFIPLKQHYDEQVVQIHVMVEYVQRGLQAMAEALRLAMDYFRLQRAEFLSLWLPEREKELARQTTPESWRAIVESLNNPNQQKIVTDDRDQANVLILAGPGSGKTRVLVHRIAYLVRARRENPRGILALAYNRHAAVEIRRRLAELIGDDAKGVIVLTCHALAMRLVGASFAERATDLDDAAFQKVLREASALLKGEGLPPEEADEQRDRFLAGFRWILVDEYQDIGLDQYELISALAGRTLQDEDGRLSLFAVGDDDQNIYAFNKASIKFIRCFEADYAAKPVYLIENYRSTAHIITAANRVIDPARERMKTAHPITVNRSRAKAPAGGNWQKWDAVSQGRVQVLPAGGNDQTQAMAVMAELERLAGLAPDWDWAKTAVIARARKRLDPLRAYCESRGIPVQTADEQMPNLWRLRETQALLQWLQDRGRKPFEAAILHQWLDGQPTGFWWALLREAADDYAVETCGAESPYEYFREWLAQWSRDARRRQTGLLLLTAHRAKGLEFDHVAVLDGGWDTPSPNEDRDAPRRLYYVAMTRAKKILALARFNHRSHSLLDSLPASPELLRRQPVLLPPPPPILSRLYERPTLKDIDIGFIGRHPPNHHAHRAIARLTTGDSLNCRTERGRWVLANGEGDIVGRLALSFKPPAGASCIEARVAAVCRRTKEDEKPEYQRLICCDCWEVVMPELTFEPTA
ncbi:MAG TPA: RecQ family ATP-dependent DNA helicase [Candidatus Competibacteraceae bacterium]|nr:RecQ family ATP-dependent DNA helicase [Candidatus Competibacteraceae bacterium]